MTDQHNPSPRENLKEAIEQSLSRLRIRLGPNSMHLAQRNEPIRLSGQERDTAADLVLDGINEVGYGIAPRMILGEIPEEICSFTASYDRHQGFQEGWTAAIEYLQRQGMPIEYTP